jgi:hypothetical protein
MSAVSVDHSCFIFWLRTEPVAKDSILSMEVGCSDRVLYREDFYFVDWFHGSALHGDRGAACREAHTNFSDESACLTADNVRNEVITIHRSQKVLKILSLYT